MVWLLVLIFLPFFICTILLNKNLGSLCGVKIPPDLHLYHRYHFLILMNIYWAFSSHFVFGRNEICQRNFNTNEIQSHSLAIYQRNRNVDYVKERVCMCFNGSTSHLSFNETTNEIQSLGMIKSLKHAFWHQNTTHYGILDSNSRVPFRVTCKNNNILSSICWWHHPTFFSSYYIIIPWKFYNSNRIQL